MLPSFVAHMRLRAGVECAPASMMSRARYAASRRAAMRSSMREKQCADIEVAHAQKVLTQRKRCRRAALCTQRFAAYSGSRRGARQAAYVICLYARAMRALCRAHSASGARRRVLLLAQARSALCARGGDVTRRYASRC